LQSVDLNGALFSLTHIAISCAEFTNWTELTAGESEWVIREDDFGSTIPVFVLNIIDEGFYIDRG